MMDDASYRFSEFAVLPAERRVFRGETALPLPPKAFDALYLLVRNHGSLVPREEIIRTLWPGVHVTEANLTNIVVLLRKVLGKDAIQTVSKFGYRFTLPVTGEPGVKQATYATFVRAKELLNERSHGSIARARDLFWVCLAEDPQFAPAWAWLGRACRLMEKFRGESPGQPNLAQAAFHRAFAIDPGLACAHQFYTQLQVDSGCAQQAMARLAARRRERGDEPETLAGLVQVLRCCGLLHESIAMHERSLALDPTVDTSVAHTHFLLGDFARVFETYPGKGYYLDAASWAGLGNTDRAIMLLRARVTQPNLGHVMSDIMASLLAVLEGRNADGLAIIERTKIVQEPEALFYLARHCGMMRAAGPAIDLIQRARMEGFVSSLTLEHDTAFASMRGDPAFVHEMHEAQLQETQSRRTFRLAMGSREVDALAALSV